MLDLGELGVWIALVDQGVEKFHCLPDAHLGAVPGEELFFLVQNEIARLVSVILAIKLANTRGRGLAIIAEFVGFFLLGVASLDEVIPLFQAPERAKLICQGWFHRVHGWVLLLCLPSIHRVVWVSSVTEAPPPRGVFGKEAASC